MANFEDGRDRIKRSLDDVNKDLDTDSITDELGFPPPIGSVVCVVGGAFAGAATGAIIENNYWRDTVFINLVISRL